MAEVAKLILRRPEHHRKHRAVAGDPILARFGRRHFFHRLLVQPGAIAVGLLLEPHQQFIGPLVQFQCVRNLLFVEHKILAVFNLFYRSREQAGLPAPASLLLLGAWERPEGLAIAGRATTELRPRLMEPAEFEPATDGVPTAFAPGFPCFSTDFKNATTRFGETFFRCSTTELPRPSIGPEAGFEPATSGLHVVSPAFVAKGL
jgi:hypothetical protein